MTLKEEILSRLAQRKAVSVAVSSKGYARHNVPEFGVVVAEDVEQEEERHALSADAYFHSERQKEIIERLSLADQTLIEGQLPEEAGYTDEEKAQAIAWAQLQEYKRIVNVKPQAYAWELEWEHGR